MVHPWCGAAESEPGQLRVEVLFIIFPPVGSHERLLETAGHSAVEEQRIPPAGNVKHAQSLSSFLPCRDYDQQSMSHTCNNRHNGNSAGQWRRRSRAVIRGPVDEMDYINSSCCSSSWSLNITVTVLTPFRKKVLQHTTEPQVCYPAAGTVPSSGSG